MNLNLSALSGLHTYLKRLAMIGLGLWGLERLFFWASALDSSNRKDNSVCVPSEINPLFRLARSAQTEAVLDEAEQVKASAEEKENTDNALLQQQMGDLLNSEVDTASDRHSSPVHSSRSILKSGAQYVPRDRQTGMRVSWGSVPTRVSKQ